MKTEIHTTPAVFDTLSDEWNDLLSPDRSTDFFMTLQWQRTWWKYLGRGSLAVLAVRDKSGDLVGIGPWFIEEHEGQRVVQTIGCKEVSDYLGILVKAGCEEAALEALLEFMMSESALPWEYFHLCNVPEKSPAMDVLPRLARSCGLRVDIEKEDICPVLALPASYDEYLGLLDKKERHELRRKRRRAEDYGVSFYTVGAEHDLDEEIDAFLGLMAMSTPDKAVFLDQPGHREFFREMGRVSLEQGWLHLLFLTVEGKRAAAMWQFGYQDRMMLYNSGLSPGAYSSLSPGIVLLTYSVEDAIRRGFQLYDFLQGDEDYKVRMGAVATTVSNVVLRRN